jgi:hypothetical protein
VSLEFSCPAKQGAKKEERQLKGREQGMFSWVGRCEGMEGGRGTWSRHVQSLGQGEQVSETHDETKCWSGKDKRVSKTKKNKKR